jgi:hypothetical protein
LIFPRLRQNLMSDLQRNQFVTLISSLLIFLFLYAALSKLWVFSTFQFQLSRSPFINRFSGITAWTLPFGEIAVCFCLLVNRARLLGLFASLFLMVMFSAYIYMMLNYSYYTPCSCGGILSIMDWHTHLYFNLFVTIIIVVAILLHQASQSQVNTQVSI